MTILRNMVQVEYNHRYGMVWICWFWFFFHSVIMVIIIIIEVFWTLLIFNKSKIYFLLSFSIRSGLFNHKKIIITFCLYSSHVYLITFFFWYSWPVIHRIKSNILKKNTHTHTRETLQLSPTRKKPSIEVG